MDIFLITIPIFVILILFNVLLIFRSNRRFLAHASGNGIIFGGRGSGKTLLMSYYARKIKSVISNIPLSEYAEVVPPAQYFQAGDNTPLSVLEDGFNQFEANLEYVGIPYLLDDVSVYMSNLAKDKYEKLFPSLPLFLTLQRHIYNSYTILSCQDLGRPWKPLRELQRDYAIHVTATYSFFRFWLKTRYIYYSNPESAEKGIRPAKRGLFGKRKDAHIEVEAIYGVVKYGSVVQRKKSISYDTRYFSKFVNYKDPNEGVIDIFGGDYVKLW